MSALTETEFSAWVWETFANAQETGLFREPDFLPLKTLYSTGLVGSLLTTIVNGRSVRAKFNAASFPAESEYNALIKHLRNVTHSEPAWCFYFLDHDDAYGELAQVWKWSPSPQFDQLQVFEIHPASQSGAAHLGIVADSTKWMLLHHFYPHKSFEIIFHAGDSLMKDLFHALGMT